MPLPIASACPARGHRVRTAVLCVVGALLAIGARGQPPADRELRVFDLEIIVFRSIQPIHLDERQWIEAEQERAEAAGEAGAPQVAVDADGIDTVPDDGGTGAARAPMTTPGETGGGAAGGAARARPDPPDAAEADDEAALPDLLAAPVSYHWERPPPELFTLLATQTYQLQDIARRIRRSSDYDLLLHSGWRQYTFPRDEANAHSIDVDLDGHRLHGDVRLAVERRLHLALDLVLQSPDGAEFRLEQSRVMRSGEQHYIDHPAFGVIALITPAEFPQSFPQVHRLELALDATLLPPALPLARKRLDPLSPLDAPAQPPLDVPATTPPR
jgi:hypothetical protein